MPGFEFPNDEMKIGISAHKLATNHQFIGHNTINRQYANKHGFRNPGLHNLDQQAPSKKKSPNTSNGYSQYQQHGCNRYLSRAEK